MTKIDTLELFVAERLEESTAFNLHMHRERAQSILYTARRYRKVELYKRVVPLYREILREIAVRDMRPKNS